MNALPLRKDQRDELLEVLDRVIFITRSNYEAANLLVLPLAHKPNLMNELYAFACEMRRAQLNEAEIGHTKLAGNGRLDYAVSASLNDEDVGHYVDAGNGQINVAPSSSLNGNAVGHGRCAQPEGQCVDAPAFPSHSNGSGHVASAGDGQHVRATPLLPVGEDVGHSRSAGNGLLPSATSSPLSRDGDGQSGVAAGHLNSAVPHRGPALRQGPRPDARFQMKHNPPRHVSEANVQGIVGRKIEMSLMVMDANGKVVPLRTRCLREMPAYFEDGTAQSIVALQVWQRHSFKPANMDKRIDELEPNFAALEREARIAAKAQWKAEVRT